jgi:hypothetical protein
LIYPNLQYEDVQPNVRYDLEEVQEEKPKPKLPWHATVFGGGDFIQFSEMNRLIGSDALKSTLYVGGELGIPLNDSLQLLLRFEDLTRSTSTSLYDLSVSSLPLSTGLDVRVTHSGALEGHISLLVGYAFKTQFSATARQQASPNLTEFSTGAFNEMLKFDLRIPLGSRCSLYGEAGYRFLKTASIGPETVGNGGTVFQAGGIPTSLDLSGPFVGGGLGFSF